jgi:hypothetical protein
MMQRDTPVHEVAQDGVDIGGLEFDEPITLVVLPRETGRGCKIGSGDLDHYALKLAFQ